MQVDALVRDPLAQQVARHQQVAGKVVRLTFDDTDGVSAGVHAFLVAVEALPLIAVENEMAQFVSDGETLALWVCLAVIEDAPFCGVLWVAYQHAFAAIDVQHHRSFDLPHPFAVRRLRKHLPDNFQIHCIRHAVGVPGPQPFQDCAGRDGTGEGLGCAQLSDRLSSCQGT